MSDELETDQALRLRAALRARADRAPVRPPGSASVRRLSALRRRRRASVGLGVASVAVLVGLAVANAQRDPSPSTAVASERKGPKATTTTVPATVPDVTSPALDAIPLPTVGAYPRDPAMGPQPRKVTYVVLEGDTIETIAAFLDVDPETVRTQTGGTITVGQTLSLLVSPPSAPDSIPAAGNVPVVLSGG